MQREKKGKGSVMRTSNEGRGTDSVATIPSIVSETSSIATYTSYHGSQHYVACNNHIDAEFVESEALYVAALETLLYAYIQPLTNSQQSPHQPRDAKSAPSSSSALTETFGADVQNMISCHSYILHRLGHSAPATVGDGDGSNSPFPRILFAAPPSTPSTEAATAPPSIDSADDSNPNSCSSNRGSGRRTSADAAESFPSVLLQMTPMLAEVYERYITNFDAHVSAAEMARSRVPDAIWTASYASLAQLTLRTKAMSSLCAANFIENGELPQHMETMLCTFDTSFSALVALPAQRIARYSLLIQEWVKAQREVDAVMAVRTSASSPSPSSTIPVALSNSPLHSPQAPHSPPSPSTVASPFRSCRVEEYRNAIAAAARLHTICETVNHIRSALETTKELVQLERQLGISNGGLSLHTGQVITLRSRLTKYKYKGVGQWNPKPCYAILLETLLLVVECFDESRRKCKRLIRIPLVSVSGVCRLSITLTKYTPLDIDRGFVIRYRPMGSHDGKRSIFSRAASTKDSDGLEELVLLDDDNSGRELWMQELPLRVSMTVSAL